MDDFIRGFFGRRRNPGEGHSRPSQEDAEDFMNRSSIFDSDRGGGLDDMFEHFHRDMFHQMESLQRQMEDMMKGFGAVDFPSEDSHSPIEPSKPNEFKDSHKGNSDSRVFFWSSPSPFFRQNSDSIKKSPRDFMLKDEADTESRSRILAPSNPKNEDGPIIPFPRHGLQGSNKRGDSDLDGKISDDKLMDMIKRPRENDKNQALEAPLVKPRRFFSGQSVSVSTIRGADGKVEQKRVIRDSSGREESTVTRSIGDKSHSITTITDDSGKQEKHENMQNMNEGDLSKFDEIWSQPRPQEHGPFMTPRSSYPMHPSPPVPLFPEDRGLFTRLFGPWHD